MRDERSLVDIDNKNLGLMGEDIATLYMAELGWDIVERNYNCRAGEIDIIASKDRLLIFVEVKTRRTVAFGIPAEAVTENKRKHIRRTAAFYLTEKMRIRRKFDDYRFRFDVIEVNFVGDRHEVSHMEDAF
jgi:putative endonuclease